MREIVGRTPAEEIRTTGRLAAQDQVVDITQTTLDAYQAGILITGIKLEKADPPAEVLDAFEEVQRAEQDQASSINEADQYANQKQPRGGRRSGKDRRRCQGLQGAGRASRRKAKRSASSKSMTSMPRPRM